MSLSLPFFKRLRARMSRREPLPDVTTTITAYAGKVDSLEGDLPSYAAATATVAVKGRSRTHRGPLLRCLPGHLVFRIAQDYLSPADRALLALTCHDLYACLGKIADGSTLRARLSRVDFLAFLSAIARDLPRSYECVACLRLHRADWEEGHSRDASLVARVSRESWIERVPSLEPPCRRLEKYQRGGQGGIEKKDSSGPLSFPSPTPPSYRLHTFADTLSPLGNRTPFAGLLHRDAQLALKQSRMLQDLNPLRSRERKHRLRGNPSASDYTCSSTRAECDRQQIEKALRQALTPFKAERTMVRNDISYDGSTFKNETVVYYTFTPKIVVGRDGRPRYLLRTAARVSGTAATNVPLSICPHELLNHRAISRWRSAQSKAEDNFWPYLHGLRTTHLNPEGPEGAETPFRLDAAVSFVQTRLIWAQVQQYRALFSFGGGGAEADDTFGSDEHSDVGSCCARCPTDFLVRASRKWLEVAVWQDFGPEGSAADLLWQSHLPGLFLQAETGEEPYTLPNTWESGPSVVHEPGSVRKLYEKFAASDVFAA